jgi:hypothetical protein
MEERGGHSTSFLLLPGGPSNLDRTDMGDTHSKEVGMI